MNTEIKQQIKSRTLDARSAGSVRGAVATLLLIHAILVGWQAWRWSPTVDEVAHLPAGLSHWQFGRFDLYRVNPPLIRMTAAIPLTFFSPQLDWSSFTEDLYARPEFSIGRTFVRSNGREVFWYFTLARLACLPVSLLGGWVCYCWGRECFGTAAGLVSLAAYVFCPNILGYASLMTPDAGAAALGALAGYTFWRWLRQPTALGMVLAGICLGLAELTKSTWIILFGLWPVLTLFWIMWSPPSIVAISNSSPKQVTPQPFSSRISLRGFQLSGVLLLGLYVLNLGYGFEKSFQRLDQFRFISHALSGSDTHELPGNRFAGTWLGAWPIPLPANYLQGLDVQRFDFERGKWSYLGGQQKMGGWWYYYLYALTVKVPAGTILLCGLAGISTLLRIRERGWISLRDDVTILAPGLVVLVLVSSQTGFNRYLRYVLPMFPFIFVWASQVGSWFELDHALNRYRRPGSTLAGAAVGLTLLASVGSSLVVWPHTISYFNELAGGPMNGPQHLLDANIDWGQDLLYFQEWTESHPQCRPLYFSYFGFFDAKTAGLNYPPVPGQPVPEAEQTLSGDEHGPFPGWHAVSVNELYGYKHTGHESDRYAYLRRMHPVAWCGYSILIFHLTLDDANRLRREMGLLPLTPNDLSHSHIP